MELPVAADDLTAYLARAAAHPRRERARVEDLLHVAGEDIGAHSVSLTTPSGTITAVARGAHPDAEDDAGVTFPVDDTSQLTIRSGTALAPHQLHKARAWAGLLKLTDCAAESPTDSFVSVLRTLRHALAALDSEDEVARYVVRAALRTAGGDAAWYAVRSARGLVIRADSGFDDPSFSRSWLVKVGEGVGGRAFTHGQTVIANDYLHDRRRVRAIAGMADREGVRSVVVAPVRRGDRVEGALYVMSRRPHTFHHGESEQLTVLGEELGYALDRIAVVAELDNRVRAVRERFDRVVAAAKALHAGTDVLLTSGSLDRALTVVSRAADVGVEVVDSTREVPIVAGSTDLPDTRTARVPGLDEASATISVAADDPDGESLELLSSGIGHLVRLHWVNQRDNFRLRRDFVTTLLRQDVRNEGETLREALAVGVDLSRPRVVVCIAGPTIGGNGDRGTGDQTGVRVTELLEQLVSERLKAALCVRVDGFVAVLADLAARTPRDVVDVLRGVISDERLVQRRLAAGIGGQCAGAADYARSWRAARIAAKFAQYRRPPAVVNIDEVGVFSLFAQADVEATLAQDITLLLGPLKALPAPLVETLDAYVHNGFSAEDAARALHIHPNTLRYRLRRAQERLGMDLRHGDQRFLLELSLRARRLIAG